MASWTYPIFAYSLSLAWGLRICILKSFQQIMIPQHENLLILSSQLDCITLKETHSSRSPRKVGRMQTPRSLNSKPCAFCRATDFTVFWASGPSPRAYSPPCSRPQPLLWSQACQAQTLAKSLRPANCSSAFPGAPVRELGASITGVPDRVSASGLDRLSLFTQTHPSHPHSMLHVRKGKNSDGSGQCWLTPQSGSL